MAMITTTLDTEASPMRITLTDEVLSSLPIYVSRMREPQEYAEVEAAIDAVALELKSQG